MGKRTVLLHVIEPEKQNGPNSVNRVIRNSHFLKNQYIFEEFIQSVVPGKSFSRSIRLVREMKKKIHEVSPDIVLVRGVDYSGLLVTFACYLTKTKSIITTHALAEQSTTISKIERLVYRYFVEPLQIRLCSIIYTVCDNTKKQEVFKSKVAKRKLYGTIHNPLPILKLGNKENKSSEIRKEYNISKNEIVVSVVGRVVKNKGHDDIIKAWQNRELTNLRLMIIGEGPYLDVYREKMKNQIKEGQVILLGERSDVLSILREVDIFLFATLHENLSMALLEAAWSQCAIVATNIGGNPEVIVDGINGFLIPANSPLAIVDRITYLIENRHMITSLGLAAKQSVEQKFSIELFEKKMNNIFKSAL